MFVTNRLKPTSWPIRSPTSEISELHAPFHSDVFYPIRPWGVNYFDALTSPPGPTRLIVNPAARTDKNSPIYGMPIIDADKARSVFAIKRSKNPGFAGIDNALYFSDRTWMLFGDAKNVIGELVKQLAGSTH